jgi:hypothetical protein
LSSEGKKEKKRFLKKEAGQSSVLSNSSSIQNRRHHL